MPQNNLKIASFYSSPFGVTLQEREFTSEKYRYGFQGQERDDELKGKGNSVNFTFRMHDPRLGRFFALDPLTRKYPFYSSYQFSGNKPIDHIELEGLEEVRPEEEKWVYSTVGNMWDAYWYIEPNSRGALIFAEMYSKHDHPKYKTRLEGGLDGGQPDAFRHVYWNAITTRDIGSFKTSEFTTLHELGETNPAIDPSDPRYDPISVQMDLHNNYVGRRIGEDMGGSSDADIRWRVYKGVLDGEFLMIKKNEKGEFLDKEGKVTTDPTKKVLVKSNGEEFNGNLLGQKGYKPDLNSNKDNPNTITPSGGYDENKKSSETKKVPPTHNIDVKR